MKLDAIIGMIFVAILIVSGLLKHQSAVDLEKEKDLKELHSLSDLFHIH